MRVSICLLLLLVISFLAASKTSEKIHQHTPEEAHRELDRFNSMISGLKGLRINEIGQGPVSASVVYAREKGIRLTQKTMGREELIIAADQSEFWFWMRSFDPDSAYYCSRQSVQNTRLRPELYPCVFIGILCADPIPLEKSTMINRPSGPVIMTTEDGLIREIEIREGKIVSQKFYSGTYPLVSVNFTEFQESSGFILPKRAVVFWHDQSRQVTINFGKAEINAAYDVDIAIPRDLSKVNLEGF